MYTSAVFYGLICMFTWGIINFSVGRISPKLGNFKTSFLIQVFAVLPMLFLSFFYTVSFNLSHFLLISILGLLTTGAYLSLTKGYSVGSVSIVTTIMSTWAIVPTILSFIFLNEEITIIKLLGIITCFFGILILSADFKSIRKASQFKLMSGAKWGLVAALGLGLQTFLIAVFSRHMDWFTITLNWRIWTGLIFLILAAILKKNFTELVSKVPFFIWIVVILDVFVNIVLNIGLSRTDPSVVTMVASASPLVTIVLSVIFLKERLTWLKYLGIFVCLSGIFMLSYA